MTAEAPPSEPPLRILHVITSLARGGAQAHLLTLMRGQKRRGHAVELAFLKDPVMVSEFADVVPLPLQANLGVGQVGDSTYAALLGRLWGLVSAMKPDVLHTHLLKADALGAVAGRFGGARVTIASKHNDEAALRKRHIAFLHGALSRLNDRIIVLSDHVGRYVVEVGRVPPEKIRRVYYGIDLNRPIALSQGAVRALRRELDLPPDGPFLLCVGRLDEQKGHPTLFDAMRRVVAAEPTARLVVAGGAQQSGEDYAAYLRSLAAEPELDGRIIFAGERTDVPRLMAACDLFVLASRWEGFGLVFLEAMAAGKPVVTTNVSGIPEVVLHEQTGLLVPPGDPAALAAAIVKLCADPTERRRLGNNGYERAHLHFTADRMLEETLDVYREALASRESQGTERAQGDRGRSPRGAGRRPA